MEASDHLGIGLYTVAEASRFLRASRSTISRWVKGYVLPRDAESNLLHRPEELEFLTFGDLVELHFVQGFSKNGVRFSEIQRVGNKYRHEWGTQYPLASRRFTTDGRRLLLGEGDEWKVALTGQHQAFFEELSKTLVLSGDLVEEWRPLGVEKSVVLNPQRSFGKPIDSQSGAHTFVLADALKAEGDAAKVAWWYDTTVEAVLDSAHYEAMLKEPVKSGHLLL